MAVRFRAAAGTHLGTVRMNNEDSAVISDHLLILADGMGGHAAGEVASVVAARVFSEVDHHSEDLADSLLTAGRRTRRALWAISDADPLLESLGTTLITLVSDGERIIVGHIGDSRVYVLRDESMYQVTTDHTHVQRMIELGQLSPEQARIHPYRAMLLKSLDDHYPGPDLDLIELDPRPGDRVLLCSDGLSDYLTAEEIGAALATQDREEAVRALIDSALAATTRDNVTVVVADVELGAGDEETLTEPALIGAVADGLRLSPEASRALTDALPGFPLDPAQPGLAPEGDGTSPATGPAVDEDASTAADDAAPPAGPDRTATAPGPGPGPGGEDGGGADRPAGEPVAPAPSAAATSDRHRSSGPVTNGPGGPGESAVPAPPVWPGVLAAAFTLVALALLAWFLFG